MEILLYNSTICRLCAEENENGSLLYSEESEHNLSDLINTYLPIKLTDDGQSPRTICPGCTIQLEATMEFINLIVKGQKLLRELHQREKEIKKSMHSETDIITDNIVYEINTKDGIYQVEHPMTLQVAGLEKPKRKRGRPPKKPKTPEELAEEVKALDEANQSVDNGERDKDSEICGKRRRKTPTRFKEAVQGKELERIFKEEGVIDGEESDTEVKVETEVVAASNPKVMEVIGHSETSGELVVVVKGKGRGRPKGRMRTLKQKCAICGMEFSCVGRYMSHVAHHGPVMYQCKTCQKTFTTRLNFNQHQDEEQHAGQIIIQCEDKKVGRKITKHHTQNTERVPDVLVEEPLAVGGPETNTMTIIAAEPVNAAIEERSVLKSSQVPKSLFQEVMKLEETVDTVQPSQCEEIEAPFLDSLNECNEKPQTNDAENNASIKLETVQEEQISNVDIEPPKETKPLEKPKLKCNHCDKMFSNKQSKSMHIKALHAGARPYGCAECGAAFPYPRSLSLHALTHRRTNPSRGFACDLCGKVLNHPSSVVYHKEAEHAGQRYVCNKCGKGFKHKQLLQRHQLVHSQLRPFNCKICSASFKTKANLINHQMLHSGVKRFSCELCKQKFAHKTSLTLHMRWHTGQKPFACGVCGKSFTQKGNLSEHARIHTGEKPFRCGECARAFTTSSQYRLHQRRHTGERPYQCAHCGKRFVSRESWRGHMRREAAAAAAAGAGAGAAAGAFPHRCECGRAFAERWSLLKHRRCHTGERPFRCPHCPRAFADCSNLNKHKKQVHKQISLLATSKIEHNVEEETSPAPAAGNGDDLEERVIFVTYDVHDGETPAFHILDPEQAASIDESKVLTTCDLYEGESLLVGDEQISLEEMGEAAEGEGEAAEEEEEEEAAGRPRGDKEVRLYYEEADAAVDQHMTVTDEQGNPLHFTMQDGTRLAITSTDGKSLQVITQDGQTIPVEINGYNNEEEYESPDTIVHQLNIQKSLEPDETVPGAQYFTIV